MTVELNISVEDRQEDPLVVYDELTLRGQTPEIDAFCALFPEHPKLRARIERLQRLNGRLDDLARADSVRRHRPPDVIGDFAIGELLGEGGMGQVHVALHRGTGDRYAIKLLKSPSEIALRRFEREIALAAKLQHPNIAHVVAYGIEAGVAYLATELIDGISLRTLMRAAGKLDTRVGNRAQPLSKAERQRLAELRLGALGVPEAVQIATQLAEGLACAHAHEVIHRDIKPSNVMILRGGMAKLIDFGIAIPHAESESTAPRITQTGMFVGSPRYASPEQLRGDKRRIGPWSDTYSVGATLYEMLCGQLAFCDRDHSKRLFGGPQQTPRAPHEIDPTIPTPLSKLVMRAISPKPRSRFRDGAMLAEALSKC